MNQSVQKKSPGSGRKGPENAIRPRCSLESGRQAKESLEAPVEKGVH